MYVFESSDGLSIWSEAQKLVASDGAAGDEFGISVALYGDILVVGAYLDTTAGGATGTSYLYVIAIFTTVMIDYITGSVYLFAIGRGGLTQWSQMARLVSASVPDTGRFGAAVSVYGSLLLVSANEANGNTGT